MIAITSELATDATVLLTPEALPVGFVSTALITLVVSGATVTAIPRPKIVMGTIKVVQ
jgi:hypothetical protein